MSTFLINNSRPANSHSRDNFTIGDGSFPTIGSINPDFKIIESLDTSNSSILINDSRNIIVQNTRTLSSPDYTFATSSYTPINYPTYLDFGSQNINIIRFNTILTRESI